MAEKKKSNENIENTQDEVIENQPSEITEDNISICENIDEETISDPEVSVPEINIDDDEAISVSEISVNDDEASTTIENNDNFENNLNSDEIEDPITVQTVKFSSFEEEAKPPSEQNKNLDILMDIKLQLTVELGRTELPVKKVLELTRGSIVELEKVAGEPVELYANGKLVAQGEVVVIEDNFGLRITSITDPEDRIKGL